MNILKKAVSCFAAAAVMTSMAVTASAEYKVSHGKTDEGKNYIQWSGITSKLEEYDSIQGALRFQLGDKIYDKNSLVGFYKSSYGEYGERTVGQVVDGTTETVDTVYENLEVEISKDADGYIFKIVFPLDSEAFAAYSEQDYIGLTIVGVKVDENGNKQVDYYSGNGDIVDNPKYVEWLDWKTLFEDESSEPVSEPVSEPAASAPESTTTSTENTAKPNPVTGIGGISLTFTAAVIAAGAVIVARRKK